MFIKIIVLLLCIYQIYTLPTVYKYNENKLLEPDLVPVSSTVIPLPVYQVSYGLNVAPSIDEQQQPQPGGKPALITVHTKKKAMNDEKTKSKSSSKN